MVLSKSNAVIAAVVCSLIVLATSARADSEKRFPITDATYWHHMFFDWDPDPNGLAVVIFVKDPDPARAYSGAWRQSGGDCSGEARRVTVVGRFPAYEPGRLSGSWGPKDDYHFEGTGVETWIYRSGDFQAEPFFVGPDGSYPPWCTETAATDSSGNEIFELRRWITQLESKVPRVARGTLDFEWKKAEFGGHLRMMGVVQVEHDPGTLAPLSTSGWFTYLSSVKKTEISLEVDE